MKPIVPVPYEIQRRAWECAYVLREDFNNRLDLEARIRSEVILRSGPDSVGWRDAATMFVLYGRTVEVRV